MLLPRIADVHCTRIRFEPGDRVLVRVRQRLDKDMREKLQKSISRWAGDGVEVLIIGPDLEISIENRQDRLQVRPA